MSRLADDPIAAISTAPGRGAVGIVRVSGQSLGQLAQAVCGRSLAPRAATYLAFLDSNGRPIDHGLALFFPAPHSYTGEDVLELQGHGGPAVLQLLLARVLHAGVEQVDAADIAALQTSQSARVRLARPGEFTERAFLNGKLDLAQAEAVADLIDANTAAAARSAARSLGGEFSRQITQLLDALTQLRMLVEATLDFPEEEVDLLQAADAQGQLARLRETVDSVLTTARQGALLRDGIRVVIAGQPNVGKSSLLNALAGEELAIVTPVAGTTRDKITSTIAIEGVPLHVIDTAGLRHSDDAVERIGIARAWDEIANADVVLLVHDASRANAPEYIAENEALTSALAEKTSKNVPRLVIWNKIDIAGTPAPPDALALSAVTGTGLAELRAALLQIAGWQATPEGVYLARARHVEALREVAERLGQAHALLASAAGAPLELIAEELRLAQAALSQITGRFTSDDLLGVIFSRFCIGK